MDTEDQGGENVISNILQTKNYNCKTPNTDLEDHSHNLAEQLSKIVKLQAASDVEIDTFSGDPLEFTYFIKNFKDIIENTVDSQSGRLNRLIKYTEGEAKELIKHCVHEDKN